MTDAKDEDARLPKRKPLSMSVRALMVAVLLLALGLGWLVQRAQIQRDAVRAIKKTGGTVYYEWQRTPGKGLTPDGQPNAPKWLVQALGVDYFGSVALVNLGKTATDAEMVHVGRLSNLEGFGQGQATEITDAGAAQLAGLKKLDHVGLSNTKVTSACLTYFKDLGLLKGLHLIKIPVNDADLVNIKDLTNLEILDLNYTKVTDAGLAHLEGLVKLKQLRLVSTGIEGPGLAHLKGMSQLKWLTLNGSRVRDLSALPSLPGLDWLLLGETPVDDAGLAGLPTLPALTILDLSQTGVTDAGLVHVLRLRNSLSIIRLGGPDITDASVPTLLKLEKLTRLDLPGTKLTDAGLDQLSGLKTIRTMDLDKTSVTEAGVARLRKAHPEMRLSKEVMAAAQAKNQARTRADATKAQTPKAGPQP